MTEKALTVPLVLADPVGFIGGVQAIAGGVECEVARARAHLAHAGRLMRVGGSVHAKDVDAATIAGWEVQRGRQHVAERELKVPTKARSGPEASLGCAWAWPHMRGVAPARATEDFRNERRVRSSGSMKRLS